MKITKIQVENFKRFTDLTIQDIPESSKLVLLIGSNGSGKSSVFDAFNLMAAAVKRDTADNAAFWDYFKKKEDALASVKIQFEDSNKYVITDENYSKKPKLSANAFYGRTSFRQIPRLTRMALGQGGAVDFEKDSDRPRFFIDRDNRFENDLEKITETVLKEFFLSNKSAINCHCLLLRSNPVGL